MIEAVGQSIAIWGWEQGLRGRPRLVKCTAEFKSPILFTEGLITYTGKVSRRKNICFGTIEIIVGERNTGYVDATVVILQDEKK